MFGRRVDKVARPFLKALMIGLDTVLDKPSFLNKTVSILITVGGRHARYQ
jgi:hypothetical protein